MVDALVEHDYLAKGPSELTIKKGDIIRDVTKKQDGWWEGLLRDKRGIFPDNFARPLDKEPTIVYRNKKDVHRIRQCRVAFSYKQDHEDELNLSVGDIIDVLGEEEEGWWRGVLNGKEGVFPSNFVVEITKSGSRENLNEIEAKTPVLPPKPAKLLCEVKFAYKAENSDELNLKEGDIVTILSQDASDPGWWFGELNGRTGVFPDNFVALLDDHPNEKKHPLPKPNSVASQRKSLEVKPEKIENDTKTTPPLPAKKPLLPIKKSPSGSSGSGGIFSGIKKKFADAVDGTVASKGSSKSNELPNHEMPAESAFDQVERRPLLSDVRATRAKAPGRRPPSVVFKEGEPGIVNGNMNHTNLDTLGEQLTNSNSSIDLETTPEQKPKLREWEKHKAPWLEEMKLNQAKRTSTSPGPEQNKLKLSGPEPGVTLKLTPTEKTEPEDAKKESSPVEAPKQLSFGGRLKTPPADVEKLPGAVVLRSKVAAPTAPVRPQTIQTVHEAQAKQVPAKAAPVATGFFVRKTPSPVQKPVVLEKIVDGGDGDTPSQEPLVSQRQYIELLERIQKLEATIEKQNQTHTAAVEELRGRLQVETDLRILLQAELDKVAQCVMQV